MTLPEIDDATRARILAEERVRLEARAKLEQEAMQASRPNYWGGFVLNLLIIGLGFLTIGQIANAVVWFLLALVLVPISGGWLWPVFAFGVLLHYNQAYMTKYGTKPLLDGYTWAAVIFFGGLTLIWFFLFR